MKSIFFLNSECYFQFVVVCAYDVIRYVGIVRQISRLEDRKWSCVGAEPQRVLTVVDQQVALQRERRAEQRLALVTLEGPFLRVGLGGRERLYWRPPPPEVNMSSPVCPSLRGVQGPVKLTFLWFL